jgi:hypothetical protein
MTGARDRLAGLAALGSVGCWLGALVAANAGDGAINRGAAFGQPVPLNRARQLLDFHSHAGAQALATGLRCAGLALSAAVGAWLWGLVRARRPGLSRWMLATAIAGAALVAGATVFGYFALHHVAAQFVAGGPRTAARAGRLIDASSTLTVAAVFDFASRTVFALWIAIASLELMREGLLDRFLAYWGFGAAGALVLLPVGDAMFIGWLGSLGVLGLGYWPGGRPDAWRLSPASN